MADDLPDDEEVSGATGPAGESETRLAEFWKFHHEWDKRVRAAVVIIGVGAAILFALTVTVLPTIQWIPPAAVVACSVAILMLSRRFWNGGDESQSPQTGRRVGASALYNATIVAEVLQFVCLPCVCYGVLKIERAGADWIAPAGFTAWWLAGYGTMQMAKRVGAASLLLAASAAQASVVRSLQNQIENREIRQ